jgi:hypothetical protein
MTLTIGAFLAGASVVQFGYGWAFVGNALSFVFSALCISRLFLPGDGFRPKRQALTENEVLRPWGEYTAGLRYMRANPLIVGIALIGVGWATGGGAAQILFSIFGELVFNRGPAGIGIIWGCAGIGLLVGGVVGHRLGERLSFNGYKRAVVVCYIVHGGAYILFSQMRNFRAALVFIALSRAAVGVSSVLNFSQLLRHVANEYRGRVFATMESMVWSTMMVSMMLAGIASQYYDPRSIGAVAGALSSTTAIFWGWAHWTGRLPEPAREGVPPEELKSMENPSSSLRLGQSRAGDRRGQAHRPRHCVAAGRRGRARGHSLPPFRSRSPQTAADCGNAPLFRANLERVAEIERYVRRDRAARSAGWTDW